MILYKEREKLARKKKSDLSSTDNKKIINTKQSVIYLYALHSFHSVVFILIFNFRRFKVKVVVKEKKSQLFEYKMAVFGPQLIYTVIMFVLLTKLGKFYSLGRYILCNKLFRYLSPNSDELKKTVSNFFFIYKCDVFCILK